jgi:hypothetical protein
VTLPDWIAPHLALHNDPALQDAARTSAKASRIATSLHDQGLDHFDDPAWRTQLADVQAATDTAFAAGYDLHDIADAAIRH